MHSRQRDAGFGLLGVSNGTCLTVRHQAQPALARINVEHMGACLCRGRVKEWCNVQSRVAQRSVCTQALLTDAHSGCLQTQTCLWQGAHACTAFVASGGGGRGDSVAQTCLTCYQLTAFQAWLSCRLRSHCSFKSVARV